jgi:hypothetical protein
MRINVFAIPRYMLYVTSEWNPQKRSKLCWKHFGLC